jgi:broad specificity phosphatase PhoE
MLFIRHVTTRLMREACFPGDDEADMTSLAKAATQAQVKAETRARVARELGMESDFEEPGRMVWVSSSTVSLQTALALGMEPDVARELDEVHMGRWRGLQYAQVARAEPEALAAWRTDPDATPHGGESVSAMTARVAAWMEAKRDVPDVVAVCDVGAIRAALAHALGVGTLITARIDIAPLSDTKITPTADGGWRVAFVNRQVPV